MTTKAKQADAPAIPRNTILEGDALAVLRSLPSRSVQCVITSPPYFGLRDYGVAGQIGLETELEDYLAKMLAVFDEVFRVLKPTGTCWLNIGDSYAGNVHTGTYGKNRAWVGENGGPTGKRVPHGLKPKDLMLIPFRLALALQQAGWWIRQVNIWDKPNCFPESVTDRPTTSHEYVFLLARSERYYYDAAAIAEPANYPVGSRENAPQGSFNGKHGHGAFRAIRDTRNKRSVWTVNTDAFPDAHYAVFPTDLIEPMVLAASRPGDLVLDPFIGSGTTAVVAVQHGRDYLGIELNHEYAEMARRRIAEEGRPVVLPRKQRQQMRQKGITQSSLLDVAETEASA